MSVLQPLHAENQTNNTYINELTDLADKKNLSQRDEWHKLLHYKPRLVPGSFKSQVDAPEFFLAPDGKTDPESELTATLAGFFLPFPDDEEDQQLHPQCRFVARYQWLKKELEFDTTRLAEYQCQRFEAWMTALNPHGITLIFPTAYMNNPASMFGHTLLRIDAREQTDKTRLLAYALNFGANTGNDNGIAFALKGLMGGYPGVFSVQPYYLKVRTYNDMENRSIWEYQLNFTEEETRRILMHAWEMRGIWFDYYFFDENCSYHLLSLLETARPDLDLTQYFNYWAIPSDTVRAVVNAGLVKKTVYRPSRYEQLTARTSRLSEDEIKIMRDLANKRISPEDREFRELAIEKRAALLEAAHEYAAYQQDNRAENAGYLKHGLLQSRSEIAYISPPLIFKEPAVRADQGHDTAQVIIGIDREDHINHQFVELRPAFQDLLDPVAGYTAGAQINFFSLKFRRNIDTENIKLQHFIPVDIISLSPVTEIKQPRSWRFNFGLVRKRRQQQTPLLFKLEGGIGRSWSITSHKTFYALWEAELNSSNKLGKGFTLGMGPTIGIVAQSSEGWASIFSASAREYSVGEDHSESTVGLGLRYTITSSQTARLKFSRNRELGPSFNHVELGWQWFF